MIPAYLDADFVIAVLRGVPEAVAALRQLHRDPQLDLTMLAIQRAEVVFFLRPNELAPASRVLSAFTTEPVTEATVDNAAALYRQWNPPHGIGVNDALLAAAAIASGGTLYTRNARHFPMPGLTVVRPF